MIAPESGNLHLPTAFDSSLIGSLSLEHPALFDPRVSQSLPKNLSPGSRKRYSQYGKPPKTSMDDYDFDQYVNKRASVRSDPGDDFTGSPPPQPKNRFSRRTKVTDTKSLPFPKSDTVATNLCHLGERDALERQVNDANHRLSAFQENDIGNKISPLARGVGSRVGGSVKRGPITKFDISHPTGPLYKAVPRPPTRKKIEGTFVLQYSGGEGCQAGYYREVVTTVTVNVRPSVIFHQFEVKPMHSSKDLFELHFIIQNISKCKLEVSWRTVQGMWWWILHRWCMGHNLGRDN